MTNMFFNQKALEKMRKADDLEEALHVSNPGVILTLLACAALLAGVFSWGLFGSVHTDINVTAVKLQDIPSIACIVDIHDLSENGYELKKARAFDNFPQTVHVETVCLLSQGGLRGRG